VQVAVQPCVLSWSRATSPNSRPARREIVLVPTEIELSSLHESPLSLLMAKASFFAALLITCSPSQLAGDSVLEDEVFEEQLDTTQDESRVLHLLAELRLHSAEAEDQSGAERATCPPRRM